jgi:hypothetical protein
MTRYPRSHPNLASILHPPGVCLALALWISVPWAGAAAGAAPASSAAPAGSQPASSAAPSGGAPSAPAPAPRDTVDVRLWEANIHSDPEVVHRGQPFRLHLHLVWGSATGDEAVVPVQLFHPGFDSRGMGYEARGTRDQPGRGYAVHAHLTYVLVARREGDLLLDSLSVALVRGTARRVVRFAPTYMKVLPPVPLRPEAWNLYAFLAGMCALLAGWFVVRRARPVKPAVVPVTPEERAQARLSGLRGAVPGKPVLEELLAFIRAEAVRRHGGAWDGPGEEAFQAWAAACRAPEIVRERVGALVSHLETRRYLPEDPDQAAWHHWIDETERLWRVEEALTSAGRS